MAQFPDIEARVQAQESMSAMLHAHIEKLSQDMTASFKQLAEYQAATERDIDARFDGVDARLDKIETRLDKIDARFISLENRFERRFISLEDKFEQRFISLDNKFDSMLQLLTVLTRKIVE